MKFAVRSRVNLTSLQWLFVIAAASSVAALEIVLLGDWPFFFSPVSRGQIIGRDFINEWTGSKLLLSGRVLQIFRPSAYNQALHELWPYKLGLHSFSYPPSLLPLIAWAGLFPYRLALALWSALGVLVLSFGSGLWRQPVVLGCVVLSPAVLICIDAGQTGLITSGLLLWGMRLTQRRPLVAGLLMGLASFKPQVGVLVPVALLSMGQWRTMLGGAVSAAILAALGAMVCGVGAWRIYVQETVPYQGWIFNHTTGPWQGMTPSPLLALKRLGLGDTVSLALQAAVSVAMATLVFLTFWRRTEVRPFELLIFFAATALATPYSFSYDLPALTAAIALTFSADRKVALPQIGGAALLWSAPAMMFLAWLAAMIRGGVGLTIGAALVGAGIVLVAWSEAPWLRFAARANPSGPPAVPQSADM